MMAEAQRSSFVVVLVAFTITLCVLTKSTAASNMDGVKTELRDGSTSGSGGGNALNTAAGGGGGIFGNRRNLRSIYGLGPKMLQISRSKIPIELDLLVENEDGDRSKRFDDYGHMRFGKRGGEEQFDDYGHMRFGRST